MKRHVFSPEFLSSLCYVAAAADQLVNCVLDGKPNAEVMRELILELDRLEGHCVCDIKEIAADLLEVVFDRAEMRDGKIWLYEEEEEPCPAKT